MSLGTNGVYYWVQNIAQEQNFPRTTELSNIQQINFNIKSSKLCSRTMSVISLVIAVKRLLWESSYWGKWLIKNYICLFASGGSSPSWLFSRWSTRVLVFFQRNSLNVLLDEFFNILLWLDAFFECMIDIFVVFTESLWVSCFGEHLDRAWSLCEKALRSNLLKIWVQKLLRGVNLTFLMVVFLMPFQWAPSFFSSLPLLVRGFFHPLRIMISKNHLGLLLSIVFIDALEEFVKRGWHAFADRKPEMSVIYTIN